VKILLDISPEYYDRILSEFDEESRIYAILKNGLVLHHFEAGNDIRTVEILCEKTSARYGCLLPLFYGGKETSPSYRGNQCWKQTSFSSKPGESPSSTRHLIEAPGCPDDADIPDVPVLELAKSFELSHPRTLRARRAPEKSWPRGNKASELPNHRSE
jgi:hypothetical protein